MADRILAFAGKGGVGKTSLSAAVVRILSETYPEKRILAVDADPAVGLSTALGLEPSLTLDDVRLTIADAIDRGETATAVELLGEARFHLADCIVEKGNVSFLAIGRPEAAGCYCKINAYLKQVIELLAGNYDVVVIDGEAGVEQINRRVMERITDLILVSDASKKGVFVSRSIVEVASRLAPEARPGIIFNRVSADFDPALLPDLPPVLAVIGDDRNQRDNDMRGESVLALAPDAPLYIGAKAAVDKLMEEKI